jgi:preprotein translocase subunit SecG
VESFFQTAQILVSVLLVVVILIQIRGQGSGFFGSAQASFRTRRGVEKTLFQLTIVLAVIFTLLAILSAIRPSWLF